METINSSISVNEDFEKAVLGVILQDESKFDEVAGVLRVEDFSNIKHQLIYSAIINMSNGTEKRSIDQLTLIEYLSSTGNLVKCGGAPYITALPLNIPSIANVKYYAEAVKDISSRKRLQKVFSDLYESTADKSQSIRDVIDTLERDVSEIKNEHIKGKYSKISTLYEDFLEETKYRYENKIEMSGISTGFYELDRLTDGFKKNEYIVIGARPSIGKTSFALSILINMAINQNHSVGFFSLEMSAIDIMYKIVSMISKIEIKKLKIPTRLSQADFSKFSEVGEKFQNRNLFICDYPNMKLLDMISMARDMVNKHGVNAIFIDYMGLISLDNNNAKKFEQVSDISRSIKALARELNVPIIVLSQLTREAEHKGDGKATPPVLSQLRDSGSVEQDADIVLLMHRDRNSQEDVQETEIYVSKNRNGNTGSCKILFNKNHTQFVNAAKEYEAGN